MSFEVHLQNLTFLKFHSSFSEKFIVNNLCVDYKDYLLHRGGKFTIHILWKNFTFWYMFDSPQIKRDLIFIIMNFVYELPLELPNDLRSLKTRWRQSLVSSATSRYKTLVIASKVTKLSLHKKCPYSELFWSAFPHIRTE